MDLQSTILIVAAFLTATLSGFLGMGGGVLLLTIMATYFPPAVLIPLHGSVQLVSNGTRALINWKHITWSVLLPMAGGSLVGIAVGSQVALSLAQPSYQLSMGLFIVTMTWVPQSGASVWRNRCRKQEDSPTTDNKNHRFRLSPAHHKFLSRIRSRFFWLGCTSTALSLIVGATGPLLAPFFLKEDLNKESIIATKAGGQAITHLLKVCFFSFTGFQLSEYAIPFAGMTLAVVLGTACGKLLLGKISERAFILLYRVLVTVLAGRMVWKSLLE